MGHARGCLAALLVIPLAGCAALPTPEQPTAPLALLPVPSPTVDPATARREEAQAALRLAVEGACKRDQRLAVLHAREDVPERMNVAAWTADANGLIDHFSAWWTLREPEADGGALLEMAFDGERGPGGWKVHAGQLERIGGRTPARRTW